MDLQLQPLAQTCFVSGQPFTEGCRVASYLVSGKTGEVLRYDMLEVEVPKFYPEGIVACRWVQVFKARRSNENPDRALKLTAESLFITLADPAAETTAENTRLLQFLALMLERKRVLRPKGRSADGSRNVFEHAKTKQLFEVPVGALTPEFFIQVQTQLSVLVGGPAPKAAPAVAAQASETSAEQTAPEVSPEPVSEMAVAEDVAEPVTESQDPADQPDADRPAQG